MSAARAAAATRITFIRHGEVGNRAEFYGRLPGYWLGPAGQEQAQAAAAALADDPPATVFASPLLRACQTAMALRERRPETPFATDDRLLEVLTPFDGSPWAELEARGYDLYTGSGPPYEQPADVLSRVLDFSRDVCGRCAGRHVVAVTHGDVLAFLIGWVLGLPAEPATRGRLAEHGLPEPYPGYCSMTTLTLVAAGGDLRTTAAVYRNPWAGLRAELG